MTGPMPLIFRILLTRLPFIRWDVSLVRLPPTGRRVMFTTDVHPRKQFCNHVVSEMIDCGRYRGNQGLP